MNQAKQVLENYFVTIWPADLVGLCQRWKNKQVYSLEAGWEPDEEWEKEAESQPVMFMHLRRDN